MTNSNKKLILDVYTKAFGQGDAQFAETVIAENYIQHNPMVKTGKAGFMEFLSLLQQMPKPENPKQPIMRLLAEDNFVVVHSQLEFMGKEMATMELYRIESGMLVEHWDASEEIKDGKPMVAGTLTIDEQEPTAANKRLIMNFVRQVLIEKQVEHSARFLGQGLKALDFAADYDSFQLHRVVGEHNFVMTQSEATQGSKHSVQYDLYRVSEGLIVEHWAVNQEIPKEMAHSNGMI